MLTWRVRLWGDSVSDTTHLGGSLGCWELVQMAGMARDVSAAPSNWKTIARRANQCAMEERCSYTWEWIRAISTLDLWSHLGYLEGKKKLEAMNRNQTLLHISLTALHNGGFTICPQ